MGNASVHAGGHMGRRMGAGMGAGMGMGAHAGGRACAGAGVRTGTGTGLRAGANRCTGGRAGGRSDTRAPMRAEVRNDRGVTFGGVVGRLLAVVFALFLVLAAYFVARGFGLYQDALAAKSLDEMAASIEGREGFTPIDQLPDIYLQAVVAVEDHRFYAHPGFDVIATGRALVNDIKAGAIVEGGSTITQQLAKNQFFTQEQTLERKVAEVFMAFTMERHFSKREILELYVNSIYFGEGYEGIGEASQGYFGKAPSDLTDYEATLLAGIPNAPSAYALTQNPDLARQRQSQVLEKLVAHDYLSFADAQRIGAQHAAASGGNAAQDAPAAA